MGTEHSRWQYSLKTYLLVIALVAMAIGWWTDRQRLQNELDKAERRIQFLETSRYFDVLPPVELRR